VRRATAPLSVRELGTDKFSSRDLQHMLPHTNQNSSFSSPLAFSLNPHIVEINVADDITTAHTTFAAKEQQ
jgi:hypothetical protein